MKKSKIIIPALAMLVMSTAATVTGTVAWFSMNKTVNAEGMLVRANGSGSIVISKYLASGTGHGFPTTSTKSTAVDFADATAKTLYPSTHVGSGTGLQYVSNGDKICYETGTAKSSAVTLTYNPVNSTTPSEYFKDYDIFIAGDNREFPTQDIEIEFAPGVGTGLNNIDMAISIDFYYEAVSSGVQVSSFTFGTGGTFIGTLNVAGLDPVTNDGSTTQSKLTISNITLPASGVGALAIKMRVYYDGALVDNAGTNAYTAYTDCNANETVADYSGDTDHVYFYNDAREIVTENIAANADVDVSDLAVVDFAASTTTFARSIDYDDISDVALNVNFTAKNHV